MEWVDRLKDESGDPRETRRRNEVESTTTIQSRMTGLSDGKPVNETAQVGKRRCAYGSNN